MNQMNAMKIACDFVSIENLEATVQVSKELCQHHISAGGEDVLQLYLMLWHAWKHLDSHPSSVMATATLALPYACPICKDPPTSFLLCNGVLDHL